MPALGVFGDSDDWIDVPSVSVLLKPPVGDPRCLVADSQKCFIPVTSQDDVLRRIEAAATSAPAGQLLTFFNYDPSRLGPTRTCAAQGFACPNFEDGHALRDLDLVSHGHPILVTSESGHIVYVNPLERAALDVCAPGVTPTRAKPCHEPAVNALVEEQLAASGQLDEDLALWSIAEAQKAITKRHDPIAILAGMVKRGEKLYSEHGYTLIQEGAAPGAELAIYEGLSKTADFPFTAAMLVYDVDSPLAGAGAEVALAGCPT